MPPVSFQYRRPGPVPSIVIGFCLIVLLIYGGAHYFILGSFQHLEALEMQQNVKRAVSLIGEEVDKIKTTSGDYAGWDDAYRFVSDRNPAFVAEFLAPENFEKIQHSIVAIYDNKGNAAFEGAYDLDGGKAAAFSASLRPQFQRSGLLLPFASTTQYRAGILQLPEGLLLFVARPVLTSNFRGPSNGTMIFGRFLTPKTVARLAENLHLPLSIAPASAAGLPADFVAAKSELTGGKPIVLRIEGRQAMSGYALQTDVQGKPALLLRVGMPRDISARGTYAVAYFMSLIVVGGGIAAAMLVWGARRNERVMLQLQQKENRLSFLLSATPAVIYCSDYGGDFGANFVSDNVVALTGYRPEDFLEDPSFWASRLHPDDARHVLSDLEKLLEAGRHVHEYRFLHRDGSYRWMHDEAMLLSTSEGEPVEVIGYWIDITESKQVEAQRLEMERQLLHAQKLESLGVMAGGIAHDFNNILTSIMGNAELALMRLKPDSPVLENLQRIERSAARASDLSRQMLAYSGKGKFFIEAIDLNQLLQELLHMLELSISKKAVVRLSLAESLPVVEGDATQLRQVVMNLVINASEALLEGGGFIEIATGLLECDAGYLQGAWVDRELAAGRYLYLDVADTGCGMDGETVARLFDPFFTTKFAGRGLGMAAVLGIVRSHRGAIKVASVPGKGSTFRVLLPAVDRPAVAALDEAGAAHWLGCGTVLVVDDEEAVRTVASEMLNELGYTVVTAEDGARALELFGSGSGIDLVLLDLTMPGMDSEECCSKMMEVKPGLAMIISSGYSAEEVAQRFAGTRLAGFVEKPFKIAALRKAMHQGECQLRQGKLDGKEPT